MPKRLCDERHTFYHGRHTKCLWRPSCSCNERNAMLTLQRPLETNVTTLQLFTFPIYSHLPTFIHFSTTSFPTSKFFSYKYPSKPPFIHHKPFSPIKYISFLSKLLLQIHSSLWREIRILEISSSDPMMKIIKGSNSSVSNSEASSPPGTLILLVYTN